MNKLIFLVSALAALLASGTIGLSLRTSERDQLVARAEFWKQLYLRADSDAKYVNCLELDDNFVICEKPKP